MQGTFFFFCCVNTKISTTVFAMLKTKRVCVQTVSVTIHGCVQITRVGLRIKAGMLVPA